MDFIIYSSVFILLSFIVNRYNRKKNIRKRREKLKEGFGKKPKDRKYDYENLAYYWNEYKKGIAGDEMIDDITWNDLEMNKIFARINNCNSFPGDQILYSTLHCLPKDKQYAETLEEKINFYLSNENEREELQLLLCKLGKDDSSYYLPKFIAELDSFKIQGIWKYRVMQVLLAIFLLLSITLREPIFILISVIIYITNIIIYFSGRSKYEVHLNMLGNMVRIMTFGNKAADTKKFSYENIFHDLMDKAVLFRRLSKSIGGLVSKKDATLSGDTFAILYDYLTGGILLDFEIYNHVVKELKKKRNEFMELYRITGIMDMAITIASFRKSLPFYCTPLFNKERAIKMEDIYHPLIDNPVCNTVNLHKSCIITGSNASGKSTFIKAVAVNAVLGQSINTCMAKSMVYPYACVITSMAVTDDLMAGESYYIKEIKYLYRIIRNLSDDRLIICVIDEILRGTNTEERIAASASILDYLYKRNCFAIVASHDIELTKILGNKYINYHFREQMHDNDISFDYKIHDGVSTTRNAIKLLRYVGFPEKIITEAQNIKVNYSAAIESRESSYHSSDRPKHADG